MLNWMTITSIGTRTPFASYAFGMAGKSVVVIIGASQYRLKSAQRSGMKYVRITPTDVYSALWC
jgi:hypothetical protein